MIMKKGFTLVETLIALFIFSLATIVVGNFARDIFFYNSIAQSELEVEYSGRKILNPIISEIRSATLSSVGGYPVESVATSSLVFFSNLDSDDKKERVRYFLQGTNLKKGVIKPTGIVNLVYNSANEVVTTVVSDVRNGTTPIFSFYDTNYTGSSTPLTYPINIPTVRFVKISLVLDRDPNRLPNPVTVTTQVSIRNLKDNL